MGTNVILIFLIAWIIWKLPEKKEVKRWWQDKDYKPVKKRETSATYTRGASFGFPNRGARLRARLRKFLRTNK